MALLERLFGNTSGPTSPNYLFALSTYVQNIVQQLHALIRYFMLKNSNSSEYGVELVGCGFDSMMNTIFVPQCSNWDCGVACVKMALKQNLISYDPETSLSIANHNTPLWTIDLYCELRRQGLGNIEYYTKNVNPTHEGNYNFDWYKNLANDTDRALGLYKQCQVSIVLS